MTSGSFFIKQVGPMRCPLVFLVLVTLSTFSFPHHTISAAPNLVIGYPLNETSGASASDVSGANRTATLVNGPTWIAPGRYGGGLNLNGSSQYVRLNSPALPTRDFTWALWINRRSGQSFQTVMEAQGTTAPELEFNIENGRLSVKSSGAARLLSQTTVPINTWTHVALTRSGNTFRVYINGTADPQIGSDTRTFNFASCPLFIGVDSDSGCVGQLNGYLDATIDEVQVHASALTTSEIQQIMATPLAGGGGPPVDTTPPLRSSSNTIMTLPAGSTQATLTLATDESASCRSAQTADVPYGSMTGPFSTSDGRNHSRTVTGLTDSDVRTYYVKCQDTVGNANLDDFLITVAVGQSNPPPPPPSSGTYYVSPDGNDQGPGTFEQPFRTIDRARQAVRAINGAMSSDIQVVLRGGEYNLTSTVAFDRLDSGSNGFAVVYAGYPGEQAVLHGGRHITGWTAVGNGSYKAPAQGLRFRQLYVNGVRAIRARTPNAGSYFRIRSWDTGGRRIEVARSEVASYQRLNQAELVVLGLGVNQSNSRIASMSFSGTSAWITPQDPERTRLFQQNYPPKEGGRPYFVENALELLDSPGEWYLNTDTNEVFYRPRAGEDLATADVVVPVLERLVSVAGTITAPVHNIQFRNLTFAYTTWLVPDSEGFVGDTASIVYTQPLPPDELASYPGHRHPAAVHLDAADDITLERNVFTHLGSSALNLYSATHDNVIVGNMITDVSASGISVGLDLEGNPSDSRQIASGTVIRSNYISGTGRDYYQTIPIVVSYGDSIVIEHNEVSDAPYSGISVGWGWADAPNANRNNLIRRNEVYNVLHTMSDGGGLYAMSRQPGTVISENYVHDIIRNGTQGSYEINGIFLDNGSNLITVRDNVVQNAGDTPLRQNANGPNNTFSNNSGQSPATIAAAGLEPEYDNIRPGSVPPPSDTTPPSRSNAQPSFPLTAGTTQTSMSLSTDESAVCRYGTTANIAFGSMAGVFSSTGGVSHTTTITGLTDGSTRTYYVRCQDAAGNANASDLTISISVLSPAPPGGSVSAPVISPNGGTFTGSVTVTLSTVTSGATIRYTTDGSTPTANSSVYASPFQLTTSATVRALGIKSGVTDSTVTSASFTVNAASAPPSGLTGSFSFSESTGTQTFDSSSNQNTGTLMNSVARTAAGQSGRALSLDGVNDYVQVSSPDLPTGNFTWQVWINGNGPWQDFQAILMSRNDIGIELTLDGSGRIVVYSSGQRRILSAGTVPTGTWTHVALTRSSGQLRAYINGVQDSVSGFDGATYSFSNCPLLIGVDSDSGCTGSLNGYFKGTIDEVRIFNRALSATEIQQEMTRP